MIERVAIPGLFSIETSKLPVSPACALVSPNEIIPELSLAAVKGSAADVGKAIASLKHTHKIVTKRSGIKNFVLILLVIVRFLL